ncbi:MAG: HD domain-containing protein [Fimbriimonadaceae bacterium]
MNEAWMESVEEIAARRAALLDELAGGPKGGSWCGSHSELIDEAVKAIYHAHFRSGSPAVAVVASGGYGRRELAPWSDVDLAIVPLEENAPGLEAAVRYLFQSIHVALQDVLGLEVGYSYRLVADCVSLDVKSRTGLMDGRLVCGSAEAHKALQQGLAESLPVGEFLLAKLDERARAYSRHHDTPLVVESQLKEGAGGLRDHHSACWIADAIGTARPEGDEPFEFVLSVRNALHYAAGSRTDLFTRPRQAEVADLWRMDMLALVSRLCQSMAVLHERMGAARSAIRASSFAISPGMRARDGSTELSFGASLSQAAVGVALGVRLGLSTPKLNLGSSAHPSGPEVLYALATGEQTIRSLDHAGVLERLLPELTRCRTLMPNDTAHVYTVFEHTLRVVRNLDSLAPGSFLADVMASLSSKGALYLAALLHDAGKAIPESRHSESGALLVADVGTRWQLAAGIAEQVAWLVRNHLVLAEFLRLRDVANPATAEELGRIVERQERLDMLTLLTWADVSAVFPGAWSPAQDHLLQELHRRTTRVLSQGSPEPTDPAVYRRKLLRELRDEAIPAEEIAAFVESLPAHYLVSTPQELVRLHIQLERRARGGEATVEFFDQPELGRTDVTVCCLDSPGLLSRLLGAIYAFDLSIHGLRASTTHTDRPVALDVFSVSFAGRTIPSATAQAFAQAVKHVIAGENSVEEVLETHKKDPHRRQEVFSHRFLPGSPGILEVQAPTGRGMAYRFSRLIAGHGWNIEAARVGQWAGRATAAFYVTGERGRDLTEKEVEEALG